jgi:hypothetical protein
MKFLITGLVLQLVAASAFSASLTSRVHSVDKGTNFYDLDIVMLENGHTAFIKPEDKSLLELIERSIESQDTLELQLDDELNVLSVQTVVPAPEDINPDPEASPVPEPAESMSYDPSIVTSSEASAAFGNMRRNYQNNSQCYNRAHIWTYEEFQKTGMKTGKLFLFFTSKYIRNYRYKWWFHVTPFAYVGGLSQSNWRTMDRRYTKGLLSTKTWTNVFMLNDALCPVAEKYSDYRQHQQEEDCYLIPRSMYFWQPYDIQREENTGYIKTQYYNSEVNHAYWEAF